MRTPRKVDSNQHAIVLALRKIPGVSVLSIATVGNGCPDLIVGYQGQNHIWELKDGSLCPSARKLTFKETMFHSTWTGTVRVINSLDEALEALGLKP